MMNKKLSLLDELRQEKEIARRECAESEDRLAEHWTYLKDNTGSLLFHSTVSSIARTLGFGGLLEPKNEEREGSSGIVQNVWSGLTTYYPLIWEIFQPMLMRFVMKKVKKMFSGKKKKRKYDDDCD